MVFSRQELELLTIPQLRILLLRYGLKPTGSAALKPGFITTLMVFPEMALQQFENGTGLIRPTFDQLQIMGEILDQMGTPTPEQSALLRVSFEGRRMDIPRRYDQERFLALYKAKNHLSEVINLLGMM
ncbi:hypothetical protein [Nostoc sp. TCL26-01]|uniref:hypothetical protein n=1 Tax=Nostoc sp. TCL26-01 TaxID=2576904 RepID=UPI0015BD5845|nr:hypothetical protein [Nostoc sp. TCL26-01]QLE58747.1 hypothetical protein FD725_26540 [Nostoc sp. TCL26-01]